VDVPKARIFQNLPAAARTLAWRDRGAGELPLNIHPGLGASAVKTRLFCANGTGSFFMTADFLSKVSFFFAAGVALSEPTRTGRG